MPMVDLALVVMGVLVIAYLGLAVSVALFHPNERRRADALAVLRCLVSLVRKPKSPK